MIVHKVKVFPSKVHLPKKNQLAWKIAEIASDNATLNKDAINFNRDWLVYKDKGINLNSNNLSNWKSLYEVIG